MHFNIEILNGRKISFLRKRKMIQKQKLKKLTDIMTHHHTLEQYHPSELLIADDEREMKERGRRKTRFSALSDNPILRNIRKILNDKFRGWTRK